MSDILVLGASGMLGSMLVDYLSRDAQLCVAGAVRTDALRDRFRSIYPGAQWTLFKWASDPEAFRIMAGRQWIINAIGITKPLIRDDNPGEIRTAIEVNSLLPHEIGMHAARVGARVLQIATDCVYSGSKGSYDETAPHDSLDVYGKTKSLGETFLHNVHHLRCSIVGPEPKDRKFLMEWLRNQAQGATVNGFRNHLWNGITTLHFARICHGIIRNGLELPHLQHVVPFRSVTKAAMLREFAHAFRRTDITIHELDATSVVDRTLSTLDRGLNAALWQAAGYGSPPAVRDMIAELSSYDYRASPWAVLI